MSLRMMKQAGLVPLKDFYETNHLRKMRLHGTPPSPGNLPWSKDNLLDLSPPMAASTRPFIDHFPLDHLYPPPSHHPTYDQVTTSCHRAAKIRMKMTSPSGICRPRGRDSKDFVDVVGNQEGLETIRLKIDVVRGQRTLLMRRIKQDVHRLTLSPRPNGHYRGQLRHVEKDSHDSYGVASPERPENEAFRTDYVTHVARVRQLRLYGGGYSVVDVRRKDGDQYSHYGCALKIENQVKFATCTLLGAALTWWNGHVRTLGHDAAYAMTWGTFKKKLTDKYCPNGEIKKLEIELWNLKVRGNDVAAYTQRFQELALMCTKFLADETAKIDKYIGGLPDNIHGNVMSARPKTLDFAIELANDLMDQKLRTYAERQNENKRKADDSSRNNHQQQPHKKQNVARAYTAGPGEKKAYTGDLPLCTKCNYHHTG
ncbi:reverse transcriptase domain-containing protein [Tanacetum coccineum]